MLRAIQIFFLGIIGGSFAAQAAIPSASKDSAWKYQVNVYAENLKQDLEKSKTLGEKYRSLQKTLDELTALRENNVIHDAHDNAYMDLMAAVLESLPKENSFNKKNCDRYQYNFLNEFEPTADEGPSEPAVKPGWDVLQSLCK
ncbi:hypothetical protein D3C87_143810 [compost metagenome]